MASNAVLGLLMQYALGEVLYFLDFSFFFYSVFMCNVLFVLSKL